MRDGEQSPQIIEIEQKYSRKKSKKNKHLRKETPQFLNDSRAVDARVNRSHDKGQNDKSVDLGKKGRKRAQTETPFGTPNPGGSHGS